MIERLLDRNGGKLRLGGVQKRTTGGGQPDALDLVDLVIDSASAQALVDSVMFAVDGEQRLALPARLGCDEFAGYDETFFIGEAYGLAGAHGFVSRLQAGDADDGADYEIDFGVGGDADGA